MSTSSAPKTRKKRPAYITETVSATISNLLGLGYSIAEELASECGSAAENFPNSSHPKAEAFEEARNTLDDIICPDEPTYEKLPTDCTITDPLKRSVAVQIQIPSDKRRQPSRAIRAANAAAYILCASVALREWIDEVNQASENNGGLVEYDDSLRETEDFCDAIEEHASTLGDVAFPGMYGS